MSRKPPKGLAILAAVLLLPLAVTGAYAWLSRPTDIEVDPIRPRESVSKSSEMIVRNSPVEKGIIREKLALARAARSVDGAAVADLSIRLGDVLRSEGDFRAAGAAYADAAAAREGGGGAGHWQVREARAKAANTRNPPAGFAAVYAGRCFAERLLADGKYLEAYAAAVATLEVMQGADPAEAAEVTLLLGVISSHHGDHYREAEKVLTTARMALAATRGEDHPAFADCLHWLATLADDRGDFAGAEKLYVRAMDIQRTARGEQTAEFALTLNRYGRMCVAWWKDYSAGKCDRALLIRRRVLGEDHPDVAESMEDLARAALAAPDFSMAEGLLRKAIGLRKKAQGEEHPALAEAYSWLGVALHQQSKLAEAHAYHRRAIRLTEGARGRNHPLLARYLANYNDIFHDTCTEFSRIEFNARRVMRIWESCGLDRHPDFARALGMLALSRARDHVFRFAPDEVSGAEVDVQYAAAQQLYEEIPQGTDLPGYVRVLGNRAEAAYFDQFRTRTRAEAENWLRTAEEAIDLNGGRTHPEFHNFLVSSARVLVGYGEYDQAESRLRTAIDHVRKRFGPSHPWPLRDALSVLGGMFLHQGNNLKAVNPLGEVLSLRRQLLDRNAHGQCDGERISEVAELHYTLSGYVTAHVNSGLAADCYPDVLRVRGVSAAFLAEDRLAHDDATVRQHLAAVRSARRSLAEEAFNPPPEAGRVDWIDRLVRLADTKTDREVDLALAVQGSAAMPTIRTVDVQAALPGGVSLVDFFQYDHYSGPKSYPGRLHRQRRLCAFVVRREGKPVFVPLGASAEIEAAVGEWRSAILRGAGAGTLGVESARAVARLLWEPVSKFLGDTRTVLIAPDGPACFVSFASLPGRAPGTYLLEDYTFGYLPSGRAALDLAPRPDRPVGRGLLAVGGISYGGSVTPTRGNRVLGMVTANAPWKALPCSQVEVEDIARRFHQSHGDRPTTLSGTAADLAGFSHSLESRWRYLHFAGHGFFADTNTDSSLSGLLVGKNSESYAMPPAEKHMFGRNQLLLSGLIFARTPGDPSGGVLTAEDVGSYDLRGTELVVLSACDTGLGRSAGGEGVLGLQRAFLGAGAGSVITSLWKVDDAATSILMDEFYSNLWEKGLSKWEALRQAQLTVLKNPQRVRTRGKELKAKVRDLEVGESAPLPELGTEQTPPALWAAFVLSGDGR